MTEHVTTIAAESQTSPKFDLDTLEALAEWSVDLTARIRRAQLIFQFIDVDVDLDRLVLEVEQFKRVARAVKWRPKP